MSSSDLAISVRGLSKAYTISHQAHRRPTFREVVMDRVRHPFHKPTRETFWALKDISFDVKKGEVVGIIGRNGAGKSTLLKILSRITEPTSGRIDLYGRVGSLLEVGTGFHPELTGRENVYLNGQILGMRRKEIDNQFDAIVDFAEVEQFLDTPVKRYSSGMYVRLAFAVAAHLDPEILIIDEVLAVGDAEFQKKCLGKMREAGREGRTVLFVSHNMNAVEDLCSTVVLLDQGRVRERSNDVRLVVTDYLFGGSSGHNSAEWVNSDARYQNDWFRPRRLSLSDSDGRSLAAVQRNDADIWVQIEADVGALDPALTVGYAIYGEAGDLLYWSYHTDDAPAQWPGLRVGPCVLRGRVPKRLLNEGSYRIELIGGLTFRQWLFTPGAGAPSITLTIQGGLSDSPLWMQRRPGVLAPVLKWNSV